MMSHDPSHPVAAVPDDNRLTSTPADVAAKEVEERALLAMRVGGGLLIACALIVAFNMITGVVETMGSPVALIIDVLIGASLLQGNPKWKGFAIFRVTAGLIVFGALAIAQGDPATMIVQAALSTSLLLLLVGKPGRLRFRFGAAMCVAVLVLEFSAGFIGPLNVVNGPTHAIPGGVAHGIIAPYTVKAPPSFKLRDDAALKAEQPSTDIWLVDESEDSHVMIECVAVEDLAAGEYFNNVVNAMATTNNLSKTIVKPATDVDPHGRAELSGRMQNGVDLTYVVDTRVSRTHACGVFAFAMTRGFDGKRADLVSILDSFKFD
jgi:hypothetical protein